MRYIAVLCALCVAALSLSSCGHDGFVSPSGESGPGQTEGSLRVDPEAAAIEVIETFGWPLDPAAEPPASDSAGKTGGCSMFEFERTPVLDDIAHYSFVLPVGDGPYEKIRIHRVVRERAPYVPIRTHKNLFALHGNPGNFEMMFLFGAVAPNVPDDLALAVYLARQDVDVWGIDRSVNFVPAEETDFAFMDEWGLQYNIDALRTGMAVARATRLFTGGGLAAMNLLGYSTGEQIGFATLNHEAGLPAWSRQVGGLIAVDNYYRPAPGFWQDRDCAVVTMAEEQLAAGIYQESIGLLFNNVSLLAQMDPNGDSPIVPGLTNRGAALFAGALTWMLYDPPGAPPIHFFAGVFDESGLPVDLAYTEYEHYLDFMSLAQPYNAVAQNRDAALVGCGEANQFVENLGAVTVPVMYVGAAGGVAPVDDNTLGLLGSSDITVLTAQLMPPEAALVDIGHVDLFTAAVSQDVVWQPMLEWIGSHTGRRSRGGWEIAGRN